MNNVSDLVSKHSNDSLSDDSNKSQCFCMEPFSDNQPIVNTPCHHRFHRDCFILLVLNNKKMPPILCPACRQELTEFIEENFAQFKNLTISPPDPKPFISTIESNFLAFSCPECHLMTHFMMDPLKLIPLMRCLKFFACPLCHAIGHNPHYCRIIYSQMGLLPLNGLVYDLRYLDPTFNELSPPGMWPIALLG